MIDINHLAMTLTNCSRKRERSDETEYLPVTKRMNNLHIDGVISTNEVHDCNLVQVQSQLNAIETRIEPNYNYNNGFASHHNQTHTQPNNTHQQNQTQNQRYSPELDSNQNPVYYEANKILYEAHIQRIMRTTNTTKPMFNQKN